MTLLIAIVGYLLALLIQSRFKPANSHHKTTQWMALAIAIIAVCAHSLAIWQNMVLPTGIDVNIINLLCLLAVLVVLFNALVNRKNEHELLELSTYPIAALTLILLAYVPIGQVLLGSMSRLAGLHIVSSLTAYALLSICALLALQIAAQDAMLRQHKTHWLLQKVPLTSLENLMFRLMFAGVLLLTLGLLSGIGFIDDWFAQHLVHKTILSLLAWLVFSLLLFGRWRLGWRGLFAVRLTLLGMLLLLLAYFGAKWVLEIIFDRNWSA